MKKRILLTIAAVAAVAVGVVGMSAFEAHVINVTAHIENALSVITEPIKFGTVFPQEYLEKPFEVALSASFNNEPRVDDVEYKIVQKLKPCPIHKVECIPPDPGATCSAPDDPTCVPDGTNPGIDVPLHNATGWHYLNLCPFLSKTNTESDGRVEQNDISHPSYYVDNSPAGPSANDYCQNPGGDATGRLAKGAGDTSDAWLVDLKVPPVKGTVGQDWPTNCPVLDENDKTYGCDLWVEVTGISSNPYCGNYIAEGNEQCDDGPTGSENCTDDCHIPG